MIVVEDEQKLALKLKNPDRVLQIIPTSSLLRVDEQPYVMVRHGMEEVRVLRNLGIDAPSPILHYYSWPGRFKPFHAQLVTSEFMTLHPRCFVLNDMGTGKTVSALWAYDYLRSIGLAEKMLVVAPLSTLDPTWANTIFHHFRHLTCSVLHGTRDVRLQLLENDADIYIINHDGIKTEGILAALNLRSDITHVIVDELAAFRNARTERWKAMNQICNKQSLRSVWGMTGSPTPNEPTDAWGQCRLLLPSSVTPYYGKFREMVMRQINTYRWVPRPEASQVVRQIMRPAIRFTRDEVVDLPPVSFEQRYVELMPEQARAYKSMLHTLKMESENGQILASNEAIKTSKLMQIACGAVYDNEGDGVVLPAVNRINVVKEIIEAADAKVLVFVPFKLAVEKVFEALSENWECALIHGGVSKTKRDEIFRQFQDAKSSLRVIVAQPGTMSHGLTLVEADTIIWFAPVHSNETFQQAIARISRPGQQRPQLIVMIEGTEIERRVYHRLQHREKLQGVLLTMIKGDKE